MAKTLSLRPFIGAKDFNSSRAFYRDWGFDESSIDASMSVFTLGAVSFYLQRAYVKDWVDNTMLFLEVSALEEHHSTTKQLNLPAKYAGVRVSEIVNQPWGSEYFVHDPSGILWHVGTFSK